MMIMTMFAVKLADEESLQNRAYKNGSSGAGYSSQYISSMCARQHIRRSVLELQRVQLWRL